MTSNPGYPVRRESLKAVLLVSPFEDDHLMLRTVLHRSEWELQEARGISEAMALLARRRFPVVICERELPVGDWKALLDALQLLADPPHLIVSSVLADSRLWAEVLNLGGYDLLSKPFDSKEVLTSIGLARSNYLRKFESRPALCEVA